MESRSIYVKYAEVQVCACMEEPETNVFHVEVQASAFTRGTGIGVHYVRWFMQLRQVPTSPPSPPIDWSEFAETLAELGL